MKFFGNSCTADLQLHKYAAYMLNVMLTREVDDMIWKQEVLRECKPPPHLVWDAWNSLIRC